MRPLRIRTSRWFIYGSAGLLVFLCLAVLLASLILIRRSMQPRIGQVAGSSMEPALRGPRVSIPCDACGFRNQFTSGSWQEDRPVHCLRCRSPLDPPAQPETLEGQRIEYMLIGKTDRWPAFRKRPGPVLQRWDQVVIRKGPDQTSEIKRIVGLPGESVGIEDGDVWINGSRSGRTPSVFFQQAVLVAHWNRESASTDPASTELIPWLRSVPTPLDNALAINAHDSHVVVPANDVGVALRIQEPSPHWRLDVGLRTPSEIGNFRIDVSESETICSLPGTQLKVHSKVPGWPSPWIIVAILDDTLYVCDHRDTRFSLPLNSFADTKVEQAGAPERVGPFSIDIAEGDLAFDRCLIFRGIVYRGYGDMPTQSFPDGDGYVVLGDNVSISDDSRGAGDASVRIARDEIRGVVLPDDVGLASLLRQTEFVPAGDAN